MAVILKFIIQKVVSWYSKLRELVPVEKLIFEKYKLHIRNGSVLDIGIGGGRTTSFLFPISNAYTGIDYSENFVREINKIYPGINCKVMVPEIFLYLRMKIANSLIFHLTASITLTKRAGRKLSQKLCAF